MSRKEIKEMLVDTACALTLFTVAVFLLFIGG